MADEVKIWFDAEADSLEVQFAEAAGYMKETQHEAVMQRVDAQGHVIGFSVLGVSRLKKGKPLVVELALSSRRAIVREKPGKKYGTQAGLSVVFTATGVSDTCVEVRASTSDIVRARSPQDFPSFGRGDCSGRGLRF